MNTHEVALTRGEGRSIRLLSDLYTFKVTGEALSVYRVDGVSAEWAAAAHSPAGGRVVVGAGWRVLSIARRADADGRTRGGRGHSPRDAAPLQEYRQHTGPDDRTADTGRFRETVGRAGRASDTTDNAASGRCRRDRETDRSSAQVSPPDSPSAAMKRNVPESNGQALLVAADATDNPSAADTRPR